MHTPQKHIEESLKSIFQAHDLDPALGFLKASDRPDLCDYQCNGALAAAKALKKNPREIAQLILEDLQKAYSNLDISIAGPGFLNISLPADMLCETLNAPFENPSVAPQKTIIDYCGPNVAKPMHVGHLRSTIIGESLKRICRFVGNEVIGDIHMGDWGTQMGMIIYELSLRSPDLPYFDENFEGSYPETSPVTLEDLQEIYPVISAKCKEDESIAEQCRLATVSLQQGRPGYRALWQHFVDVSIEDMRKNLSKLDVDFDQWFGESRYQERIPALLDRLSKEKIAREDGGALIIDVEEETDKATVPPLLLRKKDGGFLYATTDLATIEERVTDFDAQRMIYVVDGRQGLHFEQVFRGARKAGFKANFDFIGFGTMNGPDGKPFKTRAGGVMRLGDLISMLIEEAQKRITDAGLGKDYTPEEMQSIAEKIGIAALKFADLQHDPVQNYQFDINKFMRFEGKTGPYILYAAVRIQSMLQKAKDASIEAGAIHPDLMPEERDLALALTRFEDYILRAYDRLAPNVLCDYAFDLAQKFSRFYTNAPIIKEVDPAKKSSRLSLAEKTLNILKILTNILGIQIPERM